MACAQGGMLEPPMMPSPDMTQPSGPFSQPVTAETLTEGAKKLLALLSDADGGKGFELPLLNHLAEVLRVSVDGVASLSIDEQPDAMQLTVQVMEQMVKWLSPKLETFRAVGPTLCTPLTQVVKGALALSQESLFSRHWLDVLGSSQFLSLSATVRTSVKDLTIVICALLEDLYCDYLSRHDDAKGADEQAALQGSQSLVEALFAGLLLLGVTSHDALREENRDTMPKEMRSFGLLNAAWGSLMRMLTSMQLAVQKKIIRVELPVDALKRSLDFLDLELQRFVSDTSTYDQSRVQILRFWLQHMAKLVGCYGSPCVTPCWTQLVNTAVEVYAFMNNTGVDGSDQMNGRVRQDLRDSVAPKLIAAIIMGLEASTPGAPQQPGSSDDDSSRAGCNSLNGSPPSVVSVEAKLAALQVRENPTLEQGPSGSETVKGSVYLGIALLERSPLLGPNSHHAMAKDLLPWLLSSVAVELYEEAIQSYEEPDSLAGRTRKASLSLLVAVSSAAGAHPDDSSSGLHCAQQTCESQLVLLACSQHPLLHQLATDVICSYTRYADADLQEQLITSVTSLLVEMSAAEAAQAASEALDVKGAVDGGGEGKKAGPRAEQGGGGRESEAQAICEKLSMLLNCMARESSPSVVASIYYKLGFRVQSQPSPQTPITVGFLEPRSSGQTIPPGDHLASIVGSGWLWSALSEAFAAAQPSEAEQDLCARLDVLLWKAKHYAGMVSRLESDANAGGGNSSASVSGVARGHVNLAVLHLCDVCECLHVPTQQAFSLLKHDPRHTGIQARCEAVLLLSHDLLLTTYKELSSHTHIPAPASRLLLAALRLLSSAADLLRSQMVGDITPVLTHLMQSATVANEEGQCKEGPEMVVLIASLAAHMNQADPQPKDLFNTLLRHPHWAVSHAAVTSLVQVSRSTPADFRMLIPPELMKPSQVGGGHSAFVDLMRAYMARKPLDGEIALFCSSLAAALRHDKGVLRQVGRLSKAARGVGRSSSCTATDNGMGDDCIDTSRQYGEGLTFHGVGSTVSTTADAVSRGITTLMRLAAALASSISSTDFDGGMVVDLTALGEDVCMLESSQQQRPLLTQLMSNNNSSLATLTKAIAGLENDAVGLQAAARAGGLLRGAADVATLNSHTSHMLAELACAVSKIRSLQDRVHTLKP